MIKKIALRFNRKMTVTYAAAMLAGSGIVSSLLGLLRERLILANFGLGPEVDAYHYSRFHVFHTGFRRSERNFYTSFQ